MKKKELIKLREKTKGELIKLIPEKKKEISETYAKTKAGQEKNLKKVKIARHDLAQVLTVIKEKDLVEKEEVKEEK